MGMVIACAAYEGGRRVADLEIDQLDDFEAGPGQFLWIGLHEPDDALLQRLQRRFGLHELAVEDARNAHQRPKLEVYGDALFLVLQTAQLKDGRVEFGETHVFAGPGYVLSVRHGPSSSYKEVRQRCESAPKMLKKGEDFVIYSLMDFIVDNYIPVADSIETEVEALEDALFDKPFDRKTVERIYALKRELLSLRRIVTPLVEITNRMTRFDVPLIDKHAHPYLRDVHDHAIRVSETIDSLRELLTSALEANLLLASVSQSEVMKKLAGWAAILAVPTAIAGIYGMNFDYMPELGWRYGYFTVLGATLAICGYLYYRFRRSGWL
jgi:magnesium transporter